MLGISRPRAATSVAINKPSLLSENLLTNQRLALYYVNQSEVSITCPGSSVSVSDAAAREVEEVLYPEERRGWRVF